MVADLTEGKQARLRLGCLGPRLGSVADFDHNPICFSLSASLSVKQSTRLRSVCLVSIYTG